MSDLPQGWASIALEDAITPRSDRVSPREMPDAEFIGMEHVEPHTNRIIETVPASMMASNAARFLAGDVLYGRMRPYLNKVVAPAFDGLASAEFIVFPQSDAIDGQFLLRRLSASDFTEFACSQYEGDRPRVKFDQLGKFDLRLPPRAEQSRIVEKLEGLLSDLDAGVAELKAAQRKLAQYRQSLLKSAVEGALTADWRAAHGRLQETGAELLQRILSERRVHWEQKQRAKFAEQGKALPKGWQAKYPEPVAPNCADLPSLPKGWTWASVDQCSLDEDAVTDGPFGSNLKSSHYTEVGPRVLRLQNIGDGRFIDAKAHISEEHYDTLKKHSVVEGDLVIAMLGEVLPRACIVPQGIAPAIVKADCARVRPNQALMKPEVLNAILNSEQTRKRVASLVKGIGRPRVNLGNLRSLPVPVPSAGEQEALDEAMKVALDACGRQNEAIQHGLRLAIAQRKNILKAAFAGQLVPQYPNDEPASELLARIRATRDQVSSVRGKRRAGSNPAPATNPPKRKRGRKAKETE